MNKLEDVWNNKEVEHRQLFNFPLSALEKIKVLHKVHSSTQLIKEIKKIFEESKKGSEIHKMLVNDFFLAFHHPVNLKNNESGKQLEKKFSQIFGAIRVDEQKKKRKSKAESESEDLEFNKILDNKDDIKKLKSNFRNKTDLLFDDLSGISMKCAIEDNKEINLGSFEFLNIVRDNKFEKYQDLKERKRGMKINDFNCGLGSEALLKSTAESMRKDGVFDLFLYRFKELFSIVYKSDIFFYHKNSDSFDMWMLSNEKLKEIIFNDVANGFNKMRWENNAIRSRSIEEMKKNSDRVYFSFDQVIDYEFLLSYFKN